jgi:hypothetical protein
MKFLAAQSERLPYGHSEARPGSAGPCGPRPQVPVTDGLTWYRVGWRGCCGRSGLTRCTRRRPA